MIRNSIQEPERRELSVGVRQRKESVELALEQLLEIASYFIRRADARIDADGFLRYRERI